MAVCDSFFRSVRAILVVATFALPMLAQQNPPTADTSYSSSSQNSRQHLCACEDTGGISITEWEQKKKYPEAKPVLFPEPEPERGSATPVSVFQLENPLTKRGKKLLESAQTDLRTGKTLEAMDILKIALDDPSTAPYAHGILGTEYLKAGNTDSAIEDLREACRIMPGYAVFHSNLAAALLLGHRAQDAEREARQALRLNSSSPQAHYLLGLSLLEQGVRREEALDQLRMAEQTVPSARQVLAQTAPLNASSSGRQPTSSRP